MGLAQAQGLLAQPSVGLGVPSPEPGFFSQRQSLGLLRLVPGHEAAAFCPLPRGGHPEKAGVGRGMDRMAGGDRGKDSMTPGCPDCVPAPLQQAWHSPAAAGGEGAERRGAVFVQACVCLSGRWTPVYAAGGNPQSPAVPQGQWLCR